MYDISVIIPVYNAEKTIEIALKSVLNQTSENIQVILINDGSSDNTELILKKYEDKDVLVVNQKNTGVSGARNTGIMRAEAEYLFFLDADDYIDKDTLQVMYTYAKKHDLDLVACDHLEPNSTLYQGNSNLVPNFVACNETEIGKYFFDLFPKSACAKLYRYDIIRKHHLMFSVNINLGEDQMFTYAYLMQAKRVGKVSGVCYHIENINPHSLSKRYIENMEMNISLQLEMWEAVRNKYPYAEKEYYKRYMDNDFYWISMYLNNLFKQGCPMSFCEKLRKIREYTKKNKDLIKTKIYDKRNPKSFIEKTAVTVVKTRNSLLIALMYLIKEKIKERKVR